MSKLANIAEHSLAPHFTIHGVEVVMDVFNFATLPANRLEMPAASLTEFFSHA